MHDVATYEMYLSILKEKKKRRKKTVLWPNLSKGSCICPNCFILFNLDCTNIGTRLQYLCILAPETSLVRFMKNRIYCIRGTLGKPELMFCFVFAFRMIQMKELVKEELDLCTVMHCTYFG